MPALPGAKGLTGAHLLESQPMAGTQTTEQQIRGKDAAADWVLLVCGYDPQAVQAVVANPLSAAALEVHGASPGAAHRLYRPAHSLVPKDLA